MSTNNARTFKIMALCALKTLYLKHTQALTNTVAKSPKHKIIVESKFDDFASPPLILSATVPLCLYALHLTVAEGKVSKNETNVSICAKKKEKPRLSSHLCQV